MQINCIQIIPLILLFIRTVSNSGIVTDCIYNGVEWQSYTSVKLICGNSSGMSDNSCYSDIFGMEVGMGMGMGGNVHQLDIGNCQSASLDDRIPELFPVLQIYVISNSQTEYLSSEDLKFYNLVTFDASHNKLTNISEALFIHIPMIAEIDLSFNEISMVEKGAFSELSALRLVQLENNPIRRFDGNALLPVLTRAKLSINWDNIEEFDFSNLKHSYHLDVLVSFPDYGFISDTRKNSLHVTIDESINLMFDQEKPPMFDQRKQAIFTNDTLKSVKYFNISNNQLDKITEAIKLLGPSTEVLDVSQNRINFLDVRMFAKFPNLTFVDLRFCEIISIEAKPSHHLSLLKHNNKLKNLNLENNPIGKIDCGLLLLLMRTPAAKISLGNIVSLETSCMKESLEIDLDGKDVVIFRSNGSEFQYPKRQFQMILNLDVAGNRLKNGPQLIESLGSSIVDLNMSENEIGELSARTFERFQNLQYLCLSHCNLSNFGFTTFYHQKSLRQLDISYNHLKKFNFTLFWRNFKELNRLNLEGNDLIEIDTVTRTTFPDLHFLAISKNNFSCDYLFTFLQQWRNITIIANPTNHQTHIDGIDCYLENHDKHNEHAIPHRPKSGTITNTQSTNGNVTRSSRHSEHPESTVTPSNNILYELRALMYVVLSICTIISAYLLVKSNFIQRFRRNVATNPIENRVLCRRNHQDTNSTQGIFIN